MSDENAMFNPWPIFESDHEYVGDPTNLSELSEQHLQYYADLHNLFGGIVQYARQLLVNGGLDPELLDHAKAYACHGLMSMKIVWKPAYMFLHTDAAYDAMEASEVERDYIELNIFANGDMGEFQYTGGVLMENERNKTMGTMPAVTRDTMDTALAPSWFYEELLFTVEGIKAKAQAVAEAA